MQTGRPGLWGVPLAVAVLAAVLALLVVTLLTTAVACLGMMGAYWVLSIPVKTPAVALYVSLATAGLFVGGGPRALRLIVRWARTRSQQHAQCQQEIRTKTSQGVRDAKGKPAPMRTLAFFHPYCNAGGGGERVLWSAVNAVCERYPNYHCVVYTGDTDATPEQILAKAKQRFGVSVDQRRVTFAFLTMRPYVEAELYPRFTMMLQSLGSLLMGVEALVLHTPDVCIDSMGYAFVLPLFAGVAGCPVAAYVHYPTISTDMLHKVQQREADFNNDNRVSGSAALSTAKLWYYRLFALIYGLVGSSASVLMANSTWTCNHLVALWWGAHARARIVYPPCDVSQLASLPLKGREPISLSVAQFRPEKNHAMQLRALKVFTDTHGCGKVQLVMVGGCRNDGDRKRVQDLRTLAQELQLEEGRDFILRTNVSYEELQEWLGRAMIGLHTMKDEHFGIGVVEFMAAGAIALAHDSAGPKGDIVLPLDGKPTGFLASSAEEYAQHMHAILTMTPDDRLQLQERARRGVSQRFSEAQFQASFVECMQPLLE